MVGVDDNVSSTPVRRLHHRHYLRRSLAISCSSLRVLFETLLLLASSLFFRRNRCCNHASICGCRGLVCLVWLLLLKGQGIRLPSHSRWVWWVDQRVGPRSTLHAWSRYRPRIRSSILVRIGLRVGFLKWGNELVLVHLVCQFGHWIRRVSCPVRLARSTWGDSRLLDEVFRGWTGRTADDIHTVLSERRWNTTLAWGRRLWLLTVLGKLKLITAISLRLAHGGCEQCITAALTRIEFGSLLLLLVTVHDLNARIRCHRRLVCRLLLLDLRLKWLVVIWRLSWLQSPTPW